jgi:hypothetical protein
VQALRQPVPPEDPDADEGRLEEERQDALECERSAEHVPDEAGVVRPVHAELELLHDAGDDPHREVDEEHATEEPGELQVVRPAGPVPRGLERRHDDGHADRQRDEQEVVDRREAELPPRQDQGIEDVVHAAVPVRNAARC